MNANVEFWQYLDELAAGSKPVVDRPQGSSHPRFPGQVYPLDYGYLEETTSIDGGGIDIWIGSLGSEKITGILCTVDLLKRDGEMKLLFGCSDMDVHQIMNFVNRHNMRAVYIPRQAGG